MGIMEAMTPMHTEVMVTEEGLDMDLPLDTLTEEAMTTKHTEVMLLTQQEAMIPKHPDMVDSHTEQEAMTPRHPDMVDRHTEEVDTDLPLDTLTEEAMDRLTEQAVMGHLTLKRSNSSHHSTSMFSIVVLIGTNQHCLPQ